MAEVIKVYQESLPELRLIGKRYTNRDRDLAGDFRLLYLSRLEEKEETVKLCGRGDRSMPFP